MATIAFLRTMFELVVVMLLILTAIFRKWVGTDQLDISEPLQF